MRAQELNVIPPGTLQLNDRLYIDKGPIDNMMYREFANRVLTLWSFTLHDSLKLLNLKDIDKSLLSVSLDPVQSAEIYNEITLENIHITQELDLHQYLYFPAYRYHTVINVSEEQAEMYCKWRTDMVNLLWSTKIKSKTKNYQKIKYRLPTFEEFELAKKVFLNEGKLLMINENSPLKINLQHLRKKDNLILYNISEFTSSDKKYIENTLQEKNVDPAENSYTFFRCICEIQ